MLERTPSSSSIEEEKEQKEPLVFEDSSHTRNVLNQLREMHKRGQFCDAKLLVGEHEVGIHRAVLASSSSYFFKLFEAQDDEERLTIKMYKLKDISWDSFKPLLDFIYTGRLEVVEDQVKAVYNLAQDLRVHAATQACAQHLITCLTPDNCLDSQQGCQLAAGIRCFAADDHFRETVSQYIDANIRDVTNSKKFYGLKKISLEIVVPDELRINSAVNEEVLPGVMTWLKEKLPDCKNKIEFLTENNIMLYLNSNNSVTDCNDVEDATIQENDLVKDYKRLTQKKQSGKVINKDSISPETMERSYMVIAIVNGTMVTISNHYRLATQSVAGEDGPELPELTNRLAPSIDIETDLSNLQGMSSNRCAFGMKSLDGKLFVCGGYDRGECLKSSEMYDVETNTWTQLADMMSPRGRFSIGQDGDCIYAFGGSNGNQDMRTVECYDKTTGKWSVLTQADRGVASPGITVLNGKMYVLGGCMGQKTVTLCKTLDLNTLNWDTVAPMKVVFHNKIYAIGGTNDWKCLNEVEVYDPVTNEWSQHSHMNIARRGAGVDVYKGKIYVVGGNDGTSALNTTEIYDPESHTWTLGPTLMAQRANCGVAVMKDRLFAVGGFNGKKFLKSIEFLDLDIKEYWRKDAPLNGNGNRLSSDGSIKSDDGSARSDDGSTKSDDGNTKSDDGNTKSDDVIKNGDVNDKEAKKD
ncbi:NS1BB-like protein [Mya arenaria]|uniref:NS1BB-like protein n=1 Tax=Mya arenaria TaxID=6604 RepID=A0ABY7GG07_MYAAR|nr:NS1BB-like protein [Mya arenaria]